MKIPFDAIPAALEELRRLNDALNKPNFKPSNVSFEFTSGSSNSVVSNMHLNKVQSDIVHIALINRQDRLAADIEESRAAYEGEDA
jgi:hypothetical protein